LQGSAWRTGARNRHQLALSVDLSEALTTVTQTQLGVSDRRALRNHPPSWTNNRAEYRGCQFGTEAA
jgi:hypothetical protein